MNARERARAAYRERYANDEEFRRAEILRINNRKRRRKLEAALLRKWGMS